MEKKEKERENCDLEHFPRGHKIYKPMLKTRGDINRH